MSEVQLNDELQNTIHQGLSEMNHEMLREKARLNQNVVRVDEFGHCYEQSARAALAELYGETISGGVQENPHPLDPFNFPEFTIK